MKTTAMKSTPPRVSSEHTEAAASARASFFTLALIMSSQLLLAVLLPIIGGVALDKKLGSGTVWTIVGLVVALLASIVVIARAAKMANSMPAPKLSPADRQAVQRRIAEEDKED